MCRGVLTSDRTRRSEGGGQRASVDCAVDVVDMDVSDNEAVELNARELNTSDLHAIKDKPRGIRKFYYFFF